MKHGVTYTLECYFCETLEKDLGISHGWNQNKQQQDIQMLNWIRKLFVKIHFSLWFIKSAIVLCSVARAAPLVCYSTFSRSWKVTKSFPGHNRFWSLFMLKYCCFSKWMKLFWHLSYFLVKPVWQIHPVALVLELNITEKNKDPHRIL